MTATAAEAFAAWCAFLAPTEGGLSLDPADTGNFTPDGRLVGTKFGISAHSYPNIDIPNLTIELANHLRKVDFWDRVRGDELPGQVAFVLAEAAYGSGPSAAIIQMQKIIGVNTDGIFGPTTWLALMARLTKPNGVNDFVIEYESQRLLFEESLGEKWDNFKVGWTRRLFGGCVAALSLDKTAMATPIAPAVEPVVVPPTATTVQPGVTIVPNVNPTWSGSVSLDQPAILQLRQQVDQTLRDAMRTALGRFTVTIKPLLDVPTGPQSPEDLPPTADNLNAQQLEQVRGTQA